MTERWRLALHIAQRHWRVYRKNLFSNVSPTLSDPLFFVLAFGLGLGSYVQSLDGRTYLEYMAPGLAALTCLMTAFFETSYGGYFRVHYEGTYKAMLTSPIGPGEIVKGEFLWCGIKGGILAAIVGVVLGCFGVIHFQYFFMVPIIGFLIALSCGAIGLLSTTYVKGIEQFQAVYSLIIAPLYFLSGIFFPYKNLHPILQNLVQISPLFHGVRLFQDFLWLELNWGTIFYHFGCLVLLNVVLVAWARKRFMRLLMTV